MSSNVQQEIRQKHGFQSLSQEGVVALLRTAMLARRKFESLAQKEGITFQQYNVLRILRGAGEGLPTMQVAERMIEPEPGITRLLGRLERKNLIQREQSSQDARSYLCSITKKGEKIVAKLHEPVSRLDEEMLEVLTIDQQQAFIEFLDIIRDRISNSSKRT